MSDQSKPRPIPINRLHRMGILGGLAARVAGSATLNGVRKVSSGEKPEWRDLILTPANLQRVTRDLARMRGAAMKVGQLLSMDSGDLMPPELAEILARLRDQSDTMPPKQLKHVLSKNWGEGWAQKVARFDVRPVASASIGQVHRVTMKDGRDLALKVQFPGVADSIDSDLENLHSLLGYSGILPKGFDLKPFLAAARDQLHQETDYLTEGANMTRFAKLLAGDERFLVPDFQEDLSTKNLLAMSFVTGQPIETLTSAPQATRDQVMGSLFELMAKEMFVFNLMQTDPNLANYRYNPETNQVILLDFGATRAFEDAFVDAYKTLLKAGISDDLAQQRSAALGVGLVNPEWPRDAQETVYGMVTTTLSQMLADAPFDFANSGLSKHLQTKGLDLAKQNLHPPDLPPSALFVQRKLGGMYLLAVRLNANVNLKTVLTASVPDILSE